MNATPSLVVFNHEQSTETVYAVNNTACSLGTIHKAPIHHPLHSETENEMPATQVTS